MKTQYKFLRYLLVLPLLFLFAGCEDVLEEKIYSQLAPGNYLTTEDGIEAAVGAVYNQFFNRTQESYRWLMDVFEAGYGYNEGGSFEARYAQIHEEFLLTSLSYQPQDSWGAFYRTVRNANIVLDNLELAEFDQDFYTLKKSEALALRGYTYWRLYNYFGPTPIFTSSQPEDDKVARATDQEMMSRIESDLTEAIADLPVEQADWGRITRGGAMGILCKYYLNTKQWDNAASMAQQIIALNEYELQPTYQDIFSYDNKKNAEIMVVIPSDATNAADWVMQGLTIPNDYVFPPGISTYAARLYGFDSFLDSFDPLDARDDDFVLSYVNTTGATVPGYGEDKSLIGFKFPMDPLGIGVNRGFDFPVVRYADILLTRAEALNEINGPNQESIDLINDIRTRAGVGTYNLADFASKDELRDAIFQERRWEFFIECKSREDMRRYGNFISDAQARGKAALDYMELYPIPQVEIEANPNCEQNPGY